jgi:mannose-6-phosphate isomerase
MIESSVMVMPASSLPHNEGQPEIKNALESDQRPWGTYAVFRDEPHYKLKTIVVNPGQRLSLQLHHKREEHWILVKGKAEVTLGETVHSMSAGSYIHIPVQTAHRIANVGETPVEFVEIQLGSYFGEDDIVRLQDDYKRA